MKPAIEELVRDDSSRMWGRSWGWIVVACVGCHAGAGPVIAFSRHGVRAGGEVSGGAGPLGMRAGGTTALLGSGPGRWYVSFDPALMVPLRSDDDWMDTFLGFGGTFGYASGPEADGHRALGGWVSPFLFANSCDTHPAFSVTVGLRSLAGIGELFIAPKATMVAPCVD